MEGLSEETKREVYQELMSYDIPCIVFCRELKPDPIFLETAIAQHVPVLSTKEVYIRIYGRNHQMAECKAGSLYFRTWRVGGCIW